MKAIDVSRLLCLAALGLACTFVHAVEPKSTTGTATPRVKRASASQDAAATNQPVGTLKAGAINSAIKDAALVLKDFKLDGFRLEQVEQAAGSTPANLSGSAQLLLPAPFGPQRVTFSGLALESGEAKGKVVVPLAFERDFQGCRWAVERLELSDQGSRLFGTVTAGSVKVPLEGLDFTPKGVEGGYALGELPLSSGEFLAVLEEAEVVFDDNVPQVAGDLSCTLPSDFRRRDTGEPVVLTHEDCAFPAALLGGTGALSEKLGGRLLASQGGNTWLLDKMELRMERGTPLLTGEVRLQFPLDVFCRADNTGTPYVTNPGRVELRAEGNAGQPLVLKVDAGAFSKQAAGLASVTPAPAAGEGKAKAKTSRTKSGDKSSQKGSATKSGGVRAKATLAGSGTQLSRALVQSSRGFTGTFTLSAAQLLPSGLTSYRLSLESGSVRVQRGRIQPTDTKLTGRLEFGEGWCNKVSFKDAQASLGDGLFLNRASLQGRIAVGGFLVQPFLGLVTVDFTQGHSPAGLPAAWQGVYFPGYVLYLPEELYTFYPEGTDKAWQRKRVSVSSKGGRFEANGGFSGDVAVQLTDLVNLHVSPVRLEPFELHFYDGVVLQAPKVKGMTELVVDPLFKEPGLRIPLSFLLTLNGAEEITLDPRSNGGQTTLETDLVGVDIVLKRARLNETNLDFEGRFDFHARGAKLPSIEFDHLVLQGSGGGINGKFTPPSLGVVGQKWDNVNGSPKVDTWGYNFALSESGFGTLANGRFFVGFGGHFDINPLLNSMYNRLLFTTATDEEMAEIEAASAQTGGNDDAAKLASAARSESEGRGIIKMEKSFEFSQSLGGMASVDASMDFRIDNPDEDKPDAYFLGSGKLALDVGTQIGVDAGLRFGRKWEGSGSFPYFYALGHYEQPEGGLQIAPDVEIYGLAGGIAQNFLPDNIRDTENISGKADQSLGLAIMAGVDLGSTDKFAFHGNLDLYVSQNLTTVLQGDAYLFCDRSKAPEDQSVHADIRFTRNPNTFQATFDAHLSQYGGLVEYIGTVEMKFSPKEKYVHIGTKDSPITVKTQFATGTGYMMVDYINNGFEARAGMGFSWDTGECGFGIIYGRAYINARGDIEIFTNPRQFRGMFHAAGGAEFGMKFKTFWKTYRLRVFKGDFETDMALQIPGSPMLSGRVIVHYSVLGGAFSGNASAKLEFN